MPDDPTDFISLLDWRRRVNDLYARVRASYSEDPSGAWQHWRDTRDELFLNHPQSPLRPEARETFTGLPYWPYDPALAFRARLEPTPPEHFDTQTSGPEAMAFTRFARLATPLGNLDAYWLRDYGGGVFLPFRDATAGHETYGGGRYLLDTAKSADLGGVGDELILDFNFSYHPSCFYDPRWSCPLAPTGNRLDMRVEGGERAN